MEFFKRVARLMVTLLILAHVTVAWIRFRSPSSRRNYLTQTPKERLQNCGGENTRKCGMCGDALGETSTTSLPDETFTPISGPKIEAHVAFRFGMGGEIHFRLCEVGLNATENAERCRKTRPVTSYSPRPSQNNVMIGLKIPEVKSCERCVVQVVYQSDQNTPMFYDCAPVRIIPTIPTVGIISGIPTIATSDRQSRLGNQITSLEEKLIFPGRIFPGGHARTRDDGNTDGNILKTDQLIENGPFGPSVTSSDVRSNQPTNSRILILKRVTTDEAGGSQGVQGRRRVLIPSVANSNEREGSHGRVLIPRVNSDRNWQTGNLATRVRGNLATIQTDNLETRQSGNLATSQSGNLTKVQLTRNSARRQTGNLASSLGSNMATGRNGNIALDQMGNIAPMQSGSITTSQNGSIATSNADNLGTMPTGSIEANIAGNLATDQSDNIATNRIGNLATSRTGSLATSRTGNLATRRTGNLGTSRIGNLATSRTGNVATSRTGNLVTSRIFDLATAQTGNNVNRQQADIAEDRTESINTNEQLNLRNDVDGNAQSGPVLDGLSDVNSMANVVDTGPRISRQTDIGQMAGVSMGTLNGKVLDTDGNTDVMRVNDTSDSLSGVNFNNVEATVGIIGNSHIDANTKSVNVNTIVTNIQDGRSSTHFDDRQTIDGIHNTVDDQRRTIDTAFNNGIKTITTENDGTISNGQTIETTIFTDDNVNLTNDMENIRVAYNGEEVTQRVDAAVLVSSTNKDQAIVSQVVRNNNVDIIVNNAGVETDVLNKNRVFENGVDAIQRRDSAILGSSAETGMKKVEFKTSINGDKRINEVVDNDGTVGRLLPSEITRTQHAPVVTVRNTIDPSGIANIRIVNQQGTVLEPRTAVKQDIIRTGTLLVNTFGDIGNVGHSNGQVENTFQRGKVEITPQDKSLTNVGRGANTFREVDINSIGQIDNNFNDIGRTQTTFQQVEFNRIGRAGNVMQSGTLTDMKPQRGAISAMGQLENTMQQSTLNIVGLQESTPQRSAVDNIGLVEHRLEQGSVADIGQMENTMHQNAINVVEQPVKRTQHSDVNNIGRVENTDQLGTLSSIRRTENSIEHGAVTPIRQTENTLSNIKQSGESRIRGTSNIVRQVENTQQLDGLNNIKEMESTFHQGNIHVGSNNMMGRLTNDAIVQNNRLDSMTVFRPHSVKVSKGKILVTDVLTKGELAKRGPVNIIDKSPVQNGGSLTNTGQIRLATTVRNKQDQTELQTNKNIIQANNGQPNRRFTDFASQDKVTENASTTNGTAASSRSTFVNEFNSERTLFNETGPQEGATDNITFNDTNELNFTETIYNDTTLLSDMNKVETTFSEGANQLGVIPASDINGTFILNDTVAATTIVPSSWNDSRFDSNGYWRVRKEEVHSWNDTLFDDVMNSSDPFPVTSTPYPWGFNDSYLADAKFDLNKTSINETNMINKVDLYNNTTPMDGLVNFQDDWSWNKTLVTDSRFGEVVINTTTSTDVASWKSSDVTPGFNWTEAALETTTYAPSQRDQSTNLMLIDPYPATTVFPEAGNPIQTIIRVQKEKIGFLPGLTTVATPSISRITDAYPMPPDQISVTNPTVDISSNMQSENRFLPSDQTIVHSIDTYIFPNKDNVPVFEQNSNFQFADISNGNVRETDRLTSVLPGTVSTTSSIDLDRQTNSNIQVFVSNIPLGQTNFNSVTNVKEPVFNSDDTSIIRQSDTKVRQTHSNSEISGQLTNANSGNSWQSGINGEITSTNSGRFWQSGITDQLMNINSRQSTNRNSENILQQGIDVDQTNINEANTRIKTVAETIQTGQIGSRHPLFQNIILGDIVFKDNPASHVRRKDQSHHSDSIPEGSGASQVRRLNTDISQVNSPSVSIVKDATNSSPPHRRSSTSVTMVDDVVQGRRTDISNLSRETGSVASKNDVWSDANVRLGAFVSMTSNDIFGGPVVSTTASSFDMATRGPTMPRQFPQPLVISPIQPAASKDSNDIRSSVISQQESFGPITKRVETHVPLQSGDELMHSSTDSFFLGRMSIMGNRDGVPITATEPKTMHNDRKQSPIIDLGRVSTFNTIGGINSLNKVVNTDKQNINVEKPINQVNVEINEIRSQNNVGQTSKENSLNQVHIAANDKRTRQVNKVHKTLSSTNDLVHKNIDKSSSLRSSDRGQISGFDVNFNQHFGDTNSLATGIGRTGVSFDDISSFKHMLSNPDVIDNLKLSIKPVDLVINKATQSTGFVVRDDVSGIPPATGNEQVQNIDMKTWNRISDSVRTITNAPSDRLTSTSPSITPVSEMSDQAPDIMPPIIVKGNVNEVLGKVVVPILDEGNVRDQQVPVTSTEGTTGKLSGYDLIDIVNQNTESKTRYNFFDPSAMPSVNEKPVDSSGMNDFTQPITIWRGLGVSGMNRALKHLLDGGSGTSSMNRVLMQLRDGGSDGSVMNRALTKLQGVGSDGMRDIGDQLVPQTNELFLQLRQNWTNSQDLIPDLNLNTSAIWDINRINDMKPKNERSLADFPSSSLSSFSSSSSFDTDFLKPDGINFVANEELPLQDINTPDVMPPITVNGINYKTDVRKSAVLTGNDLNSQAINVKILRTLEELIQEMRQSQNANVRDGSNQIVTDSDVTSVSPPGTIPSVKVHRGGFKLMNLQGATKLKPLEKMSINVNLLGKRSTGSPQKIISSQKGNGIVDLGALTQSFAKIAAMKLVKPPVNTNNTVPEVSIAMKRLNTLKTTVPSTNKNEAKIMINPNVQRTQTVITVSGNEIRNPFQGISSIRLKQGSHRNRVKELRVARNRVRRSERAKIRKQRMAPNSFDSLLSIGGRYYMGEMARNEHGQFEPVAIGANILTRDTPGNQTLGGSSTTQRSLANSEVPSSLVGMETVTSTSSIPNESVHNAGASKDHFVSESGVNKNTESTNLVTDNGTLIVEPGSSVVHSFLGTNELLKSPIYANAGNGNTVDLIQAIRDDIANEINLRQSNGDTSPIISTETFGSSVSTGNNAVNLQQDVINRLIRTATERRLKSIDTAVSERFNRRLDSQVSEYSDSGVNVSTPAEVVTGQPLSMVDSKMDIGLNADSISNIGNDITIPINQTTTEVTNLTDVFNNSVNGIADRVNSSIQEMSSNNSQSSGTFVNEQITLETSFSDAPLNDINAGKTANDASTQMRLGGKEYRPECQDGFVQNCRAVGAYQGIPGMKWWCFSNCKMGNCPRQKCKCTCEEASIDLPVLTLPTAIYANKLVQSSDQLQDRLISVDQSNNHAPSNGASSASFTSSTVDSIHTGHGEAIVPVGETFSGRILPSASLYSSDRQTTGDIKPDLKPYRNQFLNPSEDLQTMGINLPMTMHASTYVGVEGKHREVTRNAAPFMQDVNVASNTPIDIGITRQTEETINSAGKIASETGVATQGEIAPTNINARNIANEMGIATQEKVVQRNLDARNIATASQGEVVQPNLYTNNIASEMGTASQGEVVPLKLSANIDVSLRGGMQVDTAGAIDSMNVAHLACRGINEFQGVTGIDAWCTDMCLQGRCPLNVCECGRRN